MFVGVLLICYEISVWAPDPPMLAWDSAIGLNPICDSFDSLHGAQKHMRVSNGEQNLVAHLPLARDRRKSKLVADPTGDWWVPKGSDDSRPRLSRPAAEQDLWRRSLGGPKRRCCSGRRRQHWRVHAGSSGRRCKPGDRRRTRPGELPSNARSKKSALSSKRSECGTKTMCFRFTRIPKFGCG